MRIAYCQQYFAFLRTLQLLLKHNSWKVVRSFVLGFHRFSQLFLPVKHCLFLLVIFPPKISNFVFKVETSFACRFALGWEIPVRYLRSLWSLHVELIFIPVPYNFFSSFFNSQFQWKCFSWRTAGTIVTLLRESQSPRILKTFSLPCRVGRHVARAA